MPLHVSAVMTLRAPQLLRRSCWGGSSSELLIIALLLKNETKTNSNLSLCHNQQIFPCSVINFLFVLVIGDILSVVNSQKMKFITLKTIDTVQLVKDLNPSLRNEKNMEY